MYPYTKFGFNLWRLREARAQTSKNVAQALSLSPKEYQTIEMGQSLPSAKQMHALAELLQEDIQVLQSWVQLPEKTTLHAHEAPNFGRYLKIFDEQIETLRHHYRQTTGQHLSPAQAKAIHNFRNDMTHIVDLPVLPMHFILVCDALFSVESQSYVYLHEFRDFITKGESLAGFLSRDLYYGPFGFYAANMLYFSEKPFSNLQDCFENLTFVQGRELLAFACLQNGIYEMESDIPRLQQHADFTSLSCLFVRELARECQESAVKINFNHLYQACLLQGLGQYLLFARLKPILLGPHIEYADHDDETLYQDKNARLFREILWSLHAVISAILGAGWHFDDDVLQILLTHHDHPVSRVNANTAMLKIVNFFVDKDFPKITKADLDDLLKAYPQVGITSDSLHRVCLRLADIKNDLFERSSTLLGNYQTKTAEHSVRNGPHIAPENIDLKISPKRTDFRFDPQFQMVLKNAAHAHYENLLLRQIQPRPGESLKMALERQAGFHLCRQYLLNKDWDDVARQAQMSHDEIVFRLRNRKL